MSGDWLQKYWERFLLAASVVGVIPIGYLPGMSDSYWPLTLDEQFLLDTCPGWTIPIGYSPWRKHWKLAIGYGSIESDSYWLLCLPQKNVSYGLLALNERLLLATYPEEWFSNLINAIDDNCRDSYWLLALNERFLLVTSLDEWFLLATCPGWAMTIGYLPRSGIF